MLNINRKIKNKYIGMIGGNFTVSNKFTIIPDIQFSKTIKIKFVDVISEELADIIKKISFECASCGGPDKARIELEFTVRYDGDDIYIDDVKNCLIAYKQYSTPWNALKKDMFTEDLENKINEFIDEFTE